jgi:hypothetical protein
MSLPLNRRPLEEHVDTERGVESAQAVDPNGRIEPMLWNRYRFEREGDFLARVASEARSMGFDTITLGWHEHEDQTGRVKRLVEQITGRKRR